MRKRRTRGHIIADLSANHVERQALLCGYSVERIVHDYGLDMVLYTYTDYGEIEAESIKIQLKASDSLSVLKDGKTIAFSIAQSDLEFWLGEWLPVILIIYDAREELAYWVYVQVHFQKAANFNLALIGENTTVHISVENHVDVDAMRLFARFKEDVLRQRPEVIYYDVEHGDFRTDGSPFK